MKRSALYGLALALLAWASPALSQSITLPPQTVYGRLANGTGPGQAIPFSILTGNLLAAMTGDCTVTTAGVITCPNSGGNAIAQLTFPTQAAAVAATIASSVTAIYLEGNITAGVGPANYIRSAGNPGHSAFFQSADGAFWALNEKLVSLEMLGGGSNCSTGSFNNTTALNTYRTYINTKGAVPLLLGGCQYTFNSQPNAFDQAIPPWIQGSGINGTSLLRNFSGSAGVGFIQVTGTGGAMLRGFALNAAAGTSGGDMINIKATSSVGSSGGVFEDISIAAFSTDAYARGFVMDGSAKATGSIGVRDSAVRNVQVFGGSDTAVYLLDVIGLSWKGGGIFLAGGTGSFAGGLQAIGSALFNPMYLDMDVSTIGGNISLQNCVYCTIIAPVYGGNITLDANTSNSVIIGKVAGTFTNSGGGTNCLNVNGSCISAASVGGSVGQFQFNNGGSFGGASGLTWNGSQVVVTGSVIANTVQFGLRDTSAAFDLIVGATSSPALTAVHNLTLNVQNADRAISLAGNLTVNANTNITPASTGYANWSSGTLGAGTYGQYPGVSSNTPATAGNIGELIQSTRMTSSTGTTPITISTANPGIVSLTSHQFNSTQVVQFSAGGGVLPTAISAATNYFVCAGATLLTNSFAVATSVDNALAGTCVSGAGGSGTVNLISSGTIVTATYTPLSAISVTAGEWDVQTLFILLPGATTSVTLMETGSSATTATDTTLGRWTQNTWGGNVGGIPSQTISSPTARFSLSGTSTIYCVNRLDFSVSTANVACAIRANRVH